MILTLQAGQMKQVVMAAQAAWPAEACGLLLGDGGQRGVRVRQVVPAANIMAHHADRFEIDPAVRLRIERQLRDDDRGWRIIGHYHSHPNGCPQPSDTDLSMAYEPHLIWLIVGVMDGQAVHSTAHRLDPKCGRFRPVTLRIE